MGGVGDLHTKQRRQGLGSLEELGRGYSIILLFVDGHVHERPLQRVEPCSIRGDLRC